MRRSTSYGPSATGRRRPRSANGLLSDLWAGRRGNRPWRPATRRRPVSGVGRGPPALPSASSPRHVLGDATDRSRPVARRLGQLPGDPSREPAHPLGRFVEVVARERPAFEEVKDRSVDHRRVRLHQIGRHGVSVVLVGMEHSATRAQQLPRPQGGWIEPRSRTTARSIPGCHAVCAGGLAAQSVE